MCAHIPDEESPHRIEPQIARFEILEDRAEENEALEGNGLSVGEAQELANRTGRPVDAADSDVPLQERNSPRPGAFPERPDDPFVIAGEFLCALCRHNPGSAIELMSPARVTELGGVRATKALLKRVCMAPDFPRLDAGMTIGSNDEVEVNGDSAVVWLSVENKRKRYPELNRVRRVELDRSTGRWLVVSDPSALAYRREPYDE